MTDWMTVIALIVGLLSCLACMAIAGEKNRSRGVAFVMGLLFGVIALVVYALMPRAAPPGMRRVVCPRCDAHQNVPKGDSFAADLIGAGELNRVGAEPN